MYISTAQQKNLSEHESSTIDNSAQISKSPTGPHIPG